MDASKNTVLLSTVKLSFDIFKFIVASLGILVISQMLYTFVDKIYKQPPIPALCPFCIWLVKSLTSPPSPRPVPNPQLKVPSVITESPPIPPYTVSSHSYIPSLPLDLK